MEIGNHIKTLRTQKGVTQDAVAAALGVTAQAVSKWENGAAAPDIGLLPEISAYFGVTIDELFALTDEQRLTRIENMLYNERDLDPAAAQREMGFLLEKSRREPESGRAFLLLAWMENHIAWTHRRRAEMYAKQSLEREPDNPDAFRELAWAVQLRCSDWYAATHTQIIDWYMDYIDRHPEVWRAYLWLVDALMEDHRFDEARQYVERMSRVEHTFRTPHYRGLVTLREGKRDEGLAIMEQMCRDFPDDWMAWASYADGLAEAGELERAVEMYNQAKARQKPPRFTDPQDAIAQLYERMGDIPSAIAAHEEELEIMASEWDITVGESVDAVRREIDRLEGKLK